MDKINPRCSVWSIGGFFCLLEIFPQRLQDELVSVALLCIYPSRHLFGERTRDVDCGLHILCVLTAGAKDGVALLLAKVLKHPLLCGTAESDRQICKNCATCWASAVAQEVAQVVSVLT